MGVITGVKPHVDQTFLWRICHALDVTPKVLAKQVGVPYKDLEPLLDPRHMLVELDRDYAWQRIAEYVDEHLALCLAIKHELAKATRADQAKRALRHAQQRAREKRSSPRS